MANFPIYAPFIPSIQGLNLAWASDATITVAAGQASDANAQNQIVLANAVTVNAAVNGANGLDIGSLGNNTFYAVYVIGDTTKFKASAAILSANPSKPSLPAGYDAYRRIGYVLTDGSADIRNFTQRGNSADRAMWYANVIATDITAGQSATFAAVDCSDACPAPAKEVFLKVVLTADAGGNRSVAVRDGASASTAGQAFASAAASSVMTNSLVCPCGASGDIDYLVSNASASVALSVAGYLDAL